MITLEVLSLLVLIGFFKPDKFHFAWRGVGLIIFLAYISYLGIMLFESKGTLTIGRSLRWQLNGGIIRNKESNKRSIQIR